MYRFPLPSSFLPNSIFEVSWRCLGNNNDISNRSLLLLFRLWSYLSEVLSSTEFYIFQTFQKLLILLLIPSLLSNDVIKLLCPYIFFPYLVIYLLKLEVSLSYLWPRFTNYLKIVELYYHSNLCAKSIHIAHTNFLKKCYYSHIFNSSKTSKRDDTTKTKEVLHNKLLSQTFLFHLILRKISNLTQLNMGLVLIHLNETNFLYCST